MKLCTVIYNPYSSKFRDKYLKQVNYVLNKKDYSVKFINVNASIKISDLVKNQNDNSDLIITMGGDGTFGEAIRGFSSVKQNALYGHISTGTTNDVAKNLGLFKNNPEKSINLILSGREKQIDSVTVNDMPFGYVSAFGFLSNVSYDTKNEFKYHLGRSAYFIGALDDIIKKTIPYDITYNIGNHQISQKCLMGIISNTKCFSGLDIYNNISLNDGLFEVMLVKPISYKLILLLVKDYLTNNFNINKYSNYIKIFRTDNLNIKFVTQYPNQPINTDGDNSGIILSDNNKELNYKTGKKIKMLLP